MRCRITPVIRRPVGLPLGGQLEHGVAEVRHQVAGDHRDFALVRGGQVARGAVQVDGETAGRGRVETCASQRRDHARQHVAGARRWPCRGCPWVDEGLALRRRDDRAVALQDDEEPVRGRQRPGRVEPIAPARRLSDTPSSRAISPGCGVITTIVRPRAPRGGRGLRQRRSGRRHRARAARSPRSSSPRTNGRTPSPAPSPGPTAITVARHLQDLVHRDCGVPCRPPSRPAPPSCTPRRARRRSAWQERAWPPSRVRPPMRSAPMAARCAAPVFPREPATTSTWPKSPLCVSRTRGWTSGRRSPAVSRRRSRAARARR